MGWGAAWRQRCVTIATTRHRQLIGAVNCTERIADRDGQADVAEQTLQLMLPPAVWRQSGNAAGGTAGRWWAALTRMEVL